MRFLLTGFQPFGPDTLNPSWEALKQIKPFRSDIELVRVEIPVSYESCSHKAFTVINEVHPDAVICFGQAAGRSGITPERIAINIDDSHAPDNDGIIRTNCPIIGNAPAAYFSTLPVRAMVKTMNESHIPCSVSCSAGNFICNHLMYTVLHYLSCHRPLTVSGFIHIPCIPEQTQFHPGIPCLPLETIITGIELCVKETALFLETLG